MMTNHHRPSPAESAPAAPSAVGADRERVIGRLTESFARDELAMEEFERRVTLAYEARTAEALTALVRDLPAPGPAHPPAPPLRIESVLSSVERSGPRAVPGRLEIRAILGSVELDLRGATFEQPVTEIALDLVGGSVELKIPRHFVVENRSRCFLGSFEARETGDSLAAPGQPVVIFTGRIVLGSVAVSTR